MSVAKKVKVLFGTMTGNAEELANDLVDRLRAAGHEAELDDAGGYPVDRLREEAMVAVVISTWGEGDPPDDAEEFCHDLYDGKAGDLSNLKFTVCALGDTSYEDFCGCGRKVEEALLAAGATKLTERAELDVDFEDGYEAWAERFVAALGEG